MFLLSLSSQTLGRLQDDDEDDDEPSTRSGWAGQVKLNEIGQFGEFISAPGEPKQLIGRVPPSTTGLTAPSGLWASPRWWLMEWRALLGGDDDEDDDAADDDDIVMIMRPMQFNKVARRC